jgi:hypothetical protein
MRRTTAPAVSLPGVFHFPFVELPICPKPGQCGTPNAVLTQHNAIRRTGAYLSETLLTPQTLEAGSGVKRTFGLLGTFDVDGQVYAQPLYVPGVKLADMSPRPQITSTDSMPRPIPAQPAAACSTGRARRR